MRLSALPKTWLIDVDGTIVRHNGYLNGGDELLEGAADFFRNIPEADKIILLTSRNAAYKAELEKFLAGHGLRFDGIIFDLPMGERILVNDRKNSGLPTAYSVNKKRDEPFFVDFEIDESL